MYEDYMQNFLGYPQNGYKDTYEQCGYNSMQMNYEPRYTAEMVQNYPYSYNEFSYLQNQNNYQNFQSRNAMQEIEDMYPEIYKIVYPMVRKVCSQNNRGYSKENIDRMVEEVYSNIEVNNASILNITLNNEVRGEKREASEEKTENNDDNRCENRQIGRNNTLNDLIKILILRELLGRPGCFGPNCRPGMGPRPPMPPRPPFPRFE